MSTKRLIEVFVALLLLLILAFAGYRYYLKSSPSYLLGVIAKDSSHYNWSVPAADTVRTTYGELNGYQMFANTQVNTASVGTFEDKTYLNSLGFTDDLRLAASGPGGFAWGYIKKDKGKSQIIEFSYNVSPSSSDPNEPVQFNCPCPASVSVFVSKPF